MGGSEGRERRSSSDTSEHSSVDRPSVSRALSGAFREHPLQGALGELIGIRAAEVLFWRSARVWHDLLDISGPVDDVDIVVDADGAFPVHLETKCHLDEPNKPLFLQRARAEPVSCPRRRRIPSDPRRTRPRAHLPRSPDPARRRRVETYGDPARAISLRDLCSQYFTEDWAALRRRVAESPVVISAERLDAAFERARSSPLPGSDEWWGGNSGRVVASVSRVSAGAEVVAISMSRGVE